MTPHRIRLRAPWQVEPLAGRVRHRRRFGMPRTLDADERVWLTCAGAEGPVRAWLNGEELGDFPDPRGGFAADITGRLLPRNELVLEVALPTPEGKRLGEVALEIRKGGGAADKSHSPPGE
ncbi:MAG TPA: hypothetical protein VIL46_16785 [Gemmataceae bacterium]